MFSTLHTARIQYELSEKSENFSLRRELFKCIYANSIFLEIFDQITQLFQNHKNAFKIALVLWRGSHSVIDTLRDLEIMEVDLHLFDYLGLDILLTDLEVMTSHRYLSGQEFSDFFFNFISYAFSQGRAMCFFGRKGANNGSQVLLLENGLTRGQFLLHYWLYRYLLVLL